MDELRPNLGLLGVGLVENESFHLNHNQEKRKCSSASSNEQDFGLYGVHQGLEASPPTPAATPGRSSVGATSSVGKYLLLSSYLPFLLVFTLLLCKHVELKRDGATREDCYTPRHFLRNLIQAS